MNELGDIVIKAQNGDSNCMFNIIEKFLPLIKKYSRKLNYDGADSDLMVSIIDIVKSIPVNKSLRFEEDKYIVGYINTSIKHKYIHLLSINISILKAEGELYLDTFWNYEYKDNENAIDDHILLLNILDKLPLHQKNIIKEIFFYNFSEVELSEKLNVSRQAINRTKNRALKNLRKFAIE
ncbi:sigma-70 family RNA polymerase sigma factor [Clostridium akagii]|uniref:sigma-70 family RNA polymerase sigma factor n=1 Tax=Clostridium akagii TaxID=91623 RepID=UPI00047BA848|nr:sigma-70 family RNA polymerase sigma factor [Clostridium akagii]